MALLPVSEVYRRLLDDAGPLPAQTIPLADAAFRVLAAPIAARRTQPPFDASAMDGYAVHAEDTLNPDGLLDVIGEAAAGRRFPGEIARGRAVRIFTGAPVPPGADAVLIQENTRAIDTRQIAAMEPVAKGRNIRFAGLDFREGDALLEAGRVLDPGALSLAAAANHAKLPIVRRPVVALIATGDELVLPGDTPGPDQIIASNSFGVAAIARRTGAEVLDLGVVPDDRLQLSAAIRHARQRADIIVTLGGASVGDHDLVRAALQAEGMELAFWKIAMRPGKPLMFGRLGESRVLGLPGNPVASLICSHLFLAPLIARLGGLPHRPDLRDATLGEPMPENDRREDYVRAIVSEDESGPVAAPFRVQDSSMLNTLAKANGLIIRPPFAPAAAKGDACRVLMIR